MASVPAAKPDEPWQEGVIELDKVIREIELQLEAIEAADTLYEEASFGSRLEALDAIEFAILARMEGLIAAGGPAEALVSLRQRAETVRSRLEAVDDRLLRSVRAGIRSGALRGTELRRRLEVYAGSGRGKRCQNGGAYDSLDALIGGVFCAEPAPGETAEREPEMVAYQPTPARIIFEFVERAGFQKGDTFYDLGSGLGQVVMLVHLLGGVAGVGIEFDPAYCEYARQCAQILDLSRVDFIHADAREADYAGGTVFFLYTPFEGRMLQQVLERLREEAKTRTIGVYTYGPCTFAVSRQDWLKHVGPEVYSIDSLAAFRSFGGGS
jgi:SAM-dependent methyltransferase